MFKLILLIIVLVLIVLVRICFDYSKTLVKWVAWRSKTRRPMLKAYRIHLSHPLKGLDLALKLAELDQEIRRWHRFHPYASEEPEKQELHELLRKKEALERQRDANHGYPYRPSESSDTEGDDWRN